MTKIELTKTAIRFVVGSSVSYIVANVIKNNVEPTNIVQQGELMVGTLALGYASSEFAGRYTDQKVDEVVNWYVTNVKK